MTRLLRRALTVGALLLAATVAIAAEPPQIVGARVGLGDQYKLGCWAPLTVLVRGGDQPLGVVVTANTPDSDGVGVATHAPGGRPLSTEPGVVSEERLYVRVGQQGAPIEVHLYADGRRVAQRVFTTQAGDPEKIAAGEELPYAINSVDRLVLQAGGSVGVEPGEAEAQNGGPATHAAMITDPAALPRDAIGYESFDAVVLVAGVRAGDTSGGWLGVLEPSDPRVRALIEWVENGGRLVLSCGSGGAALLGPGGALADLAPGAYDGPETLTVATAIERYADAPANAESIDLLGGALTVSSLSDPRGRVEAFAGRTADETPLVIRSPRGFGEVMFVAFDLDAPALAGWRGRPALVRQLLDLNAKPGDTPQQRAAQQFGYQRDLVNSLLERLDTAFAGVRTAPFLAVVGLVVLYLLLIGPGDYFFVKKVLGRVEATWVTFPLLVAVTCAAAYFGANWLKGDRLRINQVEIVDAEPATGRVRGMLLTHLFSPRAERYDLSLAAKSLADAPLEPTNTSTAWLGKPGSGLGGMQSYSSLAQAGVRANYTLDATPQLGPSGAPTVAGLPIQVWSTKSLVSRYSGQTERLVDASLAPNRDGLVEGSITNDTGARLVDCRLLYGVWAWRLGDLGDGATTTVDSSVSPLKITTLLSKSSGAKTTHPAGGAHNWNTIELLAQALSVGGRSSGATGSASRYLHGLDLTHHLDAGRALMLARVEGRRSELVSPDGSLVDADDPAAEGDHKSWVFARFILDVREE